MLKVCEFKVHGDPVGKGRPRFTKTGHVYTPKKTRDFEKNVAQFAWAAMKQSKLKVTSRRVSVIMTSYFEIPKSYTKAERQDCECGILIPKKYDVDNLVKCILDGCNGIVWNDDAAVWHISAFKRYCDVGQEPHTHVKVQWDDPQSMTNLDHITPTTSSFPYG